MNVRHREITFASFYVLLELKIEIESCKCFVYAVRAAQELRPDLP